MKLYLVWLFETPESWEGSNHILHGMIIRAENEAQARELADKEEHSEGLHPYLDSSLARCRELPIEGKPEVLQFIEEPFGLLDNES